MIDELKRLIDKYLAARESRTVQSLAAKAGISYSTVRRLAQSEVKTAELSNVIAILKVVATWPDTVAYLNKHFPDTGEYLAKLTANKHITEGVNDQLPAALLNADKFAIISLCATPNGSTEELVLKTLGSKAQSYVEDLLGSELIQVRNGRLFATQQNFSVTDLDNQNVQLSHCLRFITQQNRGKQKQLAGVHTDGVDREGQKQIHSIFERAWQEADKVAAERKGDIPFSSVQSWARS